MLGKYNKLKVARVFFEMPLKQWRLRELCRTVQISPASVSRYLKELQKEGLAEQRKDPFLSWRAKREREVFKSWKRWTLALDLTSKGLVDQIVKTCLPDAVILFGSAARGEDVEASDIDIAVISEEKPIDLKKFEMVIHRKITVLFCPKFNELSPELKNNILNGIILYGYLKVF